jgi:two-component sensor histidine kinase
VLLVDDDEDDYVITRDLLSEIEGMSPAYGGGPAYGGSPPYGGRFDLEWVNTYEAALEAMEGHRHDVYLVDYRLGRRSGLEFLREALANGCRAPVILLTGQGDYEVDLEAMRAGAADFLVKGQSDASALERSIRYAIGHTRTLEALRQSEAANRALLDETQRHLHEQIALRQEKEALLKEIHHRVKNNLQIISSILNLERGRAADQQIRDALQDSQNRIRSIALIHEKLYQAHDLARIDLSEYMRELTHYLLRLYRGGGATITPTIRAEPAWLGIDMAVPCGLILNELISNALKHAFPPGWGIPPDGDDPPQQPEICVELRTGQGHQLMLIVADNGVGLPPGLDLAHTDSLGMELVNILVGQLHGRLEIRNQNGAEFQVTFAAPARVA